jgi:hypothetical protein
MSAEMIDSCAGDVGLVGVVVPTVAGTAWWVLAIDVAGFGAAGTEFE